MVLAGHQGQGHLKVKVIVSSRSFLSQIVSVWTFMMKWMVGLRLQGILVLLSNFGAIIEKSTK